MRAWDFRNRGIVKHADVDMFVLNGGSITAAVRLFRMVRLRTALGKGIVRPYRGKTRKS